MAEMLVGLGGTIISARVLGARIPVDSEAGEDAVVVGAVFPFPCMNELSAEDVLKLMQGRPYAVTFDACVAVLTSHCFNLSCFDVN